MKDIKKHKYTQAEFDAFPVIDGVKQCPTGDYSEIKHFGENCSFGSFCSFGENCSFGMCCYFGKWCSFDSGCSLGECCSFGEKCIFDSGCSFGENCSFGMLCFIGEYCSFGKWCIFGKGCSFGEDCSFGMLCSFGEDCSFKKGCVCEFGEFSQMCSFGGFGHKGRTTYAFALTDGSVGIRCEGFDGNLDEFRMEVQKRYGESKLAKEYLAIADLVSLRFGKT